MSKRQGYVEQLRQLASADPTEVAQFLVARSNLPGPRGNLELADAFADWAPDALVDAFARAGTPRPAAGGDEFLDFCVALALGERLARGGDQPLVELLRRIASDERWRVREAVATGLQRVGDRDFDRLREICSEWAEAGDPLVQRAAVAAICEPRLLATDRNAAVAVAVCSTTTQRLARTPADQRRMPAVRVLRQALGYCWSVAVAADPTAGLPVFLHLRESYDVDLRWIVRANEGKARLRKVLPPAEEG